MIVTRLVLLDRNIRNVMNTPLRVNGMTRPSSPRSSSLAAPTLSLSPHLELWFAGSPTVHVVSITLVEVQVHDVFIPEGGHTISTRRWRQKVIVPFSLFYERPTRLS